ncbi:metal ABC transporter solute-binding protein, Zn/Mn family [Teichococcus aestuarii]|uniref:metal ABC transporter solute-binding protein, Zn/Mn family n=1 Tax=Teichococcus aestuarii TaxID=568898 RepID=UPI0036229751
MVRQIGGDAVAAHVIAGPDVDAHSFQPRPSDAQALRGAGLLVRNGLGFDAWVDRLARSAGYAGPVATATEGLTPRRLEGGHGHGHSHGHSHGHGGQAAADPHAGRICAMAGTMPASSPPRWRRRTRRGPISTAPAARPIRRGWRRWMPGCGEIGRVPEARRRVVTSHDAFGYFAEAYGVRFLAPQGVSTDAEPSAAQVARLIRTLKAENITAVFLENMANPATLRRPAAEAGITVQGRLYADALSPPGGPAPSYEAMFRHNVGLLVPAMLGGAG